MGITGEAYCRYFNEVDCWAWLGDVGFFLTAGEVAFHDASGEVGGAGVEGEAFGEFGELVDEADPVHSPVVFDEGEGADAAAVAEGEGAFFEGGECAAGVWGVEEVDVAGVEVCGGLAVGDDEDLFILAGASLEEASGELEAHVEVSEVLRGMFEFCEGYAEADVVVVDGDGFGHGEGEEGFTDEGGSGVEADDVEGVLGEAGADEGLHGEGDLFGGDESAVSHHGARLVEEDDGGAVGGAFVEVKLEVAFGEADSPGISCQLPVVSCQLSSGGALPFWQALAGEGVMEGLVDVEFGDVVAVGVGFGAFDAIAGLARGGFRVAFTLALGEVGEDFGEGAALDAVDGAGSEAEFTEGVAVEEALGDELVEELGLLGVLGAFEHLLDGLEGLVAVLGDELEELIGREEVVLGGEFVAIVLGVEGLHAGGIVGGEWGRGTEGDEDGSAAEEVA